MVVAATSSPALRRTGIGEFNLDDAYTLTQLEGMDGIPRDACLLPLEMASAELAQVLELDEVQASRLAQGQRLGLSDRPS